MAVVVLGGLVTSTLLTPVRAPGALPALRARRARPARRGRAAPPLGRRRGRARTRTRGGEGMSDGASQRAGCSRSLVALVVAALAASADCGDSPSEEGGGDEQAKVEPVKGTDVSSVTLTARGGQAARDRDRGGPPRAGPQRSVVPYDAVLYDADGATFTYTSPKPRVYVRAPITVVRIDGDRRVLSSGPPVGTDGRDGRRRRSSTAASTRSKRTEIRCDALDHRHEPAVPLPRDRGGRRDDALRRRRSCATRGWTSSRSSRRRASRSRRSASASRPRRSRSSSPCRSSRRSTASRGST